MVPCRCRGVLLYHAEGAGFVKMEISASGIFRVEPFQHRLCGDSPSADGGNVPRPAAGQEGRHQGFYPLNSHFLLFRSPAQTRERRPLRKGERQSGYHSVSFVKYSQFADSVLRIGKRKGRTRSRSVLMRGKILCRSSFSKRSPVSGLRQTKKQRKRDSQGWKPWCPSLCPPPWVQR